MRVVVVGAGVAGAAAALRLATARPDLEVVVLEGAPVVGGKLAVAEVGGVVTDVGAEAMLQRRPEGVDLARAAGLADDVVVPEPGGAALWNRGTLQPLPRSLMGVPADLAVLDAVLSPEGRAAAARDADQGPVPALDDDVSVGDLVAARLGEEVVQRLVEPMLGGVYAGHAHALSARAAVPGLLARLDGTRTLVEAAAAAMPPGGPGGPVFAGIRGGVGRLPGAALAASGAEVRTDAMVRVLTRTPTGWALEVGPTRDPRRVEADAVVLTVPARPAARLLADLAPAAAADLAGIDYASMAVVTLAVTDFAGTGSGFLVPPVDGRAVKGATYSFAKWAWVGAAGAGHGVRLLRCSLGRHHEEQVLQRPDEEVVALAVADLSAAVGAPVRVVASDVRRWGGGLPQYAVGHVERVARVRAGVAALPRLAVGGAAYDGVGVPASISSGQRAADDVLAQLPGTLEP